MSSKRNLKKYINQTMDLLYVDCLFYKLFVVDADKEAANKVMTEILEERDSLRKRVNITEGREVKGRVKAYYKKLRADIREKSNKIAKDIASLG